MHSVPISANLESDQNLLHNFVHTITKTEMVCPIFFKTDIH